MAVCWRGLAGGDFNQLLVKTEAAAGCVTALTGVSGGPSVNVTEGRQARRDVRRLQTGEVTGAASGGSRWREPACQDSRTDRRQVKRIRDGLEAVRNRWEVIGAACDPACDRCVFFWVPAAVRRSSTLPDGDPQKIRFVSQEGDSETWNLHISFFFFIWKQ